MIFANPCKSPDRSSLLKQLSLYREAGHFIGNHTCRHPRFDKVGFEAFSKDAQEADQLLSPLFQGQKFFRFPYLNEGSNTQQRDKMRAWLKRNRYRNAMVSIDNDEYLVSDRINLAKEAGKTIDYDKVRELFLRHVLSAVEFYGDFAVKNLGHSPKHVLLLHEVDATVMWVEDLVDLLRRKGWTIISIEEAYKDPLYLTFPKNIYAP